jgi:hypothetical protein
MKKLIVFTLLLSTVICYTSCKKDETPVPVKTQDHKIVNSDSGDKDHPLPPPHGS